MVKQAKEKTEIEKQSEYVDKLTQDGFGFDLVVGEAFIRGMRDIGYKHTGTALDEIIDNAIEAGAKSIEIAFNSPKGNKPEAMAVIDNGHGMMPTMLRAAVMWGGTHRENSRKGIGRYGYGLPSASVSQGQRFSVYSKTTDGKWHGITIDLEEISQGKHTKNGRIVTPEPKASQPPSWLDDKLPKTHGTVVVWEKLDRLTWSTTPGLRGNLVEHFGVTYRNFLVDVTIKVDDIIVEAIDPLFITPGFRYYDLDQDRAKALEPMRVAVKIPGRDEKAIINIRMSSFSPTFGMLDKHPTAKATKGNQNPRWHIMNDHLGIVVCRMGRQMDVVTRTPKSWSLEIDSNDNRYWGLEIDFPADLDEEFGVTTSKQRVWLSERIWEILTNSGLEIAIKSLKAMYDRERKERNVAAGKSEDIRPSEKVMEEAEKFRVMIPGQTSEERERASRAAFEQEVKRRQTKERKSEEQAREELEKETTEKKYKVAFEDVISGPFFRSEQIGGQFVIYINRQHAFYSKLYADSNPKVAAALETILFVIGVTEANAYGNKEKALFYISERMAWSRQLDNALTLLDDIDAFKAA